MRPEYKALGDFGTLGLEIVLSIVVGVFGGRWVDAKLGSAPAFLIVGFICGVGAAGKAILRAWKEMKEVTAREEREQGNPAPRLDPPAASAGGAKAPREEEDDRGPS
jgi:F0F1-type ATP synthase assembly protein I